MPGLAAGVQQHQGTASRESARRERTRKKAEWRADRRVSSAALGILRCSAQLSHPRLRLFQALLLLAAAAAAAES